MRIDNRVFITPAAPFLLWLVSRLFWQIATGSGFDDPEYAAGVLLYAGLTWGFLTTVYLFILEVEIGYTQIGRGQK